MNRSNIVLIGMSGCGKTTIGELTAKKLGLKFLDTDKMVEEAEGVSIRRLFAQKGEKYFRLQETAACRAASERGGAVIATGGGVVLSRVNMSILGKTGIIVYLERDIEDILRADAQVRPLFTSRERVLEMFHERERLYKGYADITVKNDAPAEITAQKFIFLLEEFLEG